MFINLFLINLASSLALTGLIWFVQVVHYPSFLKVNSENFQLFHSFHVFRTGLVVIPFMLAELISSIILSLGNFPLGYIHQVGLGLVILIWLSTFAIQAQAHRKINSDANTIELSKLVKTNWLRTILWSLKALITLYGLNLMLQ